jgi:hypothetical protein
VSGGLASVETIPDPDPAPICAVLMASPVTDS